MVVLEDTISVKEASADRNWVATGLVRNETSGAVAGVTVVANVTDANGSPVGDITADVPVAPLRKGEPAPFEVTTAAERPGPFTIRWSARWRTDDPGARSGLKLETHWDRVIETGQPLQISGYPDSDRSEPRFALFGSAEPEEGVVARSPVAVAAWFDDAGRVIRVATTPMVQPGTDQARAELEQGEIGDFAFVIRGSDVSGLAGARHALWGVAR